jgi:hypothetical protein
MYSMCIPAASAVLRNVLVEHLGEVVGAIHIVPRKVGRQVLGLDVGLRAHGTEHAEWAKRRSETDHNRYRFRNCQRDDDEE